MAETDNKSARPLDDVMIAMDVVDTLRHDKRLVERELNDETRRAELIERLREIYKSQGIDVPDKILEDGVKALEEKRFVYSPPPSSLEVRLARLYVTRDIWGKRVGIAALAAAVAGGGWYLLYERPRQAEKAALTRELGQEIPQRVNALMGQIEREAKDPSAVSEARQAAESARSAAAGGDRKAAIAAEDRLKGVLDKLRAAYEIRIVNRRGEITGLWRVPRVNPLSRNYYLVVEAIDASGKAIAQDILNEETGQREMVTKWAVRVPKSVFDAVQADKLDDGIIQNAVLGTKNRGELEPRWRREVSGGALTRW
ncbi:MAG: DUF6384 family protein [Hyphomicrobiaceae bacterium]